ncbi:sugar-binding domain-containing protein [Parapedobacter deserti]|uniref:Sugar-binding domain-containing protein n=1 Tax=Parapedobacter deserti TaxID=1912957 RepID=A0ABV7JS49_9SPHI
MNRYSLSRIVLSAFFAIVVVQSQAQPGFGRAALLNDDWLFTLSDAEGYEGAAIDDRKWQRLDLPHDWSIKGKLDSTLASCQGYLPGGIGWYRKHLTVPASKRGEKIYLYFEGIYNRSEVYLNGQLLGKRPNGYVSFMYNATPFIHYGGDNVIAIRVDHSRNADSRWYTGSGIYRNAWLVYANPVRIAQWGVFARPEVIDGQGTLLVDVEVVNETPQSTAVAVHHTLFGPDGRLVAHAEAETPLAANQRRPVFATLKVANPQLWSLESPVLYRLVTTVKQAGKLVDSTTTITGFRTFTFDADKGFALNNAWLKMKGVCIHHDAGVLGAAVPKEVWRQRLLSLKQIGCNAIRTTHNPHNPDVYALCDELGILVLNEAFDEWEFPKRKWVEGWNVGTPALEGSYDFFKEWGEIDLADMVRRDRNHVSIFAWSIGNEVDYPNDPYSHPILDGDEAIGFTQKRFGGYKKDAPDANRLGDIASRLATVVRQHDPSRRVTAGLAGVAMSNETVYPAVLDIVGYNYTENRYISDHKNFPNRVIYGSENRHDLAAWKAVTDNEHIFGQFLWTGIDYLGESGRWPSRGFYSGLLDLKGEMKPRGYFRQSLWSDKPMAYLGTYAIAQPKVKSDDVLSQSESHQKRPELSMDAWPVWNYKPDELVRVVCYTNGAYAQLTLNGRKVGAPKPYNSETAIIHWDIPYQPGVLEVMVLGTDSREIARYMIETAGSPAAIQILQASEAVRGDGDVLQLNIRVVDKKGVIVPTADTEISCEVEGSGVLLGLESGNNRDMGNYTDNKQRAFRGALTAYVKRTGETGNVTVRISADGMAPKNIVIH